MFSAAPAREGSPRSGKWEELDGGGGNAASIGRSSGNRPSIGGAGTVGSTRSRVVESAQTRAGNLQFSGMEGQGGGVSVSNVELCNLAYAGQLEEVKEQLVANRSLATRADQVGPASGRERGRSWWP